MKNKVQLIGYLGQDPEFRTFESGACRLSFALATHDRAKSAEGTWEDRTMWHQVIMFNKVAERAQNILKQGSLCAVEGSLSYSSYTNAQEQQVTKTEVIARDFAYLGSSSAKSRNSAAEVAA